MSLYFYCQRAKLRRAVTNAPLRTRRLPPPTTVSSSTLRPFAEIFTSDNLMAALENLEARGGPAAGPDGVMLSHLSKSERWAVCRFLSDVILDGSFVCSPPLEVRIPKDAGAWRTLKLRSNAVRIPAGALHEVLCPFLDRFFLPMSFGFRPNLGTWHALATLEKEIFSKNAFILVQDDVKKAFDFININLAIEDVARHVEEPQMLNLIDRLLRGHPQEAKEVGIDQGSAISPDILNIHLHHQLDAPYSRAASHPFALRYADNVVTVAANVNAGQDALSFMQDRLRQVGLETKGEEQPVDLREEATKLLGFTMRIMDGKMLYGIDEKALQKLSDGLEEAHKTPNPPAAATAVVLGSLNAYGPALARGNDTKICHQILDMARSKGFQEIPAELLRRTVQSSQSRWMNTRKSIGCDV